MWWLLLIGLLYPALLATGASVVFARIQSIQDESLKKQFLTTLKRCRLSNSKYTTLEELITLNKKDIKLSFYQIENAGRPAYLVMLSSYSDSILMKLAKDCGLPRGMPIYFVPGKYIKLHGFLPKFDNDDRASSVPGKMWEGITSLTGWFKLSGFLGSISAIRGENGDVIVTITSKNSANENSEYISYLKDIVMDFPNFGELAEFLADNNLCIYGEVMHMLDQKHGYAYNLNSLVVTSISEARIISDEDGVPSSPPDDTKPGVTSYVSPEKVDKICERFGLLRAPRFVIKDAANIIAFGLALESNRDRMTLSLLIQLSNEFGVEWIGDVGLHERLIIGNVIEGLILNLINNDGTKQTLKYKFAEYVILTMLFRPLFEKGIDENTTVAVNRFINTWVLSVEGKTYWRRIARAVIVAYRKKLIPEVAGIGSHITYATAIKAMSDSEIDALVAQYDDDKGISCKLSEIPTLVDGMYSVSYDKDGAVNNLPIKVKTLCKPTPEQKRYPSSRNGTLYVLRGLPGSGKSSCAHALSKELKCAMVEADDTMDLLCTLGTPYDRKYVGCAHWLCQQRCMEALESNSNIVVSNTNISLKEINIYLAIAKKYGVPLILIETMGDYNSTHDIPKDTMTSMITNLATIPFETITEKTVFASGVYRKSNKVHIYAVVGSRHITLCHGITGKDALEWEALLGTFVNVTYTNVYVYSEGESSLSCVDVTIDNMPANVPSTLKANLHVTLECGETFDPVQSNDILTGKLKAQRIMPYAEYVTTHPPLSSKVMIMRVSS